MNGLKTARVVIIDDDPDEAIPLLESLSRQAIGCVWIRGNRQEDLPTEPLKGIRLVFLDMDLDVGGSSRQKISATLNVLKRVVGDECPPLIVVIWTKHADMINDFREAFRADMPNAGPGIVHSMSKPAEVTEINADAVLTELTGLLGSYSPLELLWYWEQLAHDAATETTSAVASTVMEAIDGPNIQDQGQLSTEWRTKLGHIVKALIEASGGRAVEPKTAIQHLIETLNVVHLDRLEAEAFAGSPPLPAELLTPSAALNAQERAAISTMLQTAKTPDSAPIWPGNVYVATHPSTARCPACRLELDLNELAKGCEANFMEIAGYRARRRALRATLSESEVDASEDLTEMRKGAIEACKVIAVEVSPSCDFSQIKRPVSRFVGGLLVPDSQEKVFLAKASGSAYLRAIRNIKLADGTISHLLLNARYTFGIPNPDRRIRTLPLLRLRAPVLVDIQAWLASHLARPGYISL